LVEQHQQVLSSTEQNRFYILYTGSVCPFDLQRMKLKSHWVCPAFCLFVSALAASAANDILIADFEGTDYGAWRATGEAFGKAPARGTLPGQMAVDGFTGEGLANSFVGGDKSTGTLTSPPFKIERPFISFLIGGGGYSNETCMNLIVDGKTVRTATGPNIQSGGSERLQPGGWDVREFSGRDAVVEIVDKRTGGWGHINVDQIVQTDCDYERLPALPREGRRGEEKNGSVARRQSGTVV
jgi:hypothetical protein